MVVGFIGRLHFIGFGEGLEFAQRSRNAGERAGAVLGLDLIGRLDYRQNAHHRVHLAFDHMLDAQRHRQTLLRQCCNGRLAGLGARLFRRRGRWHEHGGGRAAQRADKFEGADAGAAPAPAAFPHAPVERRPRQTQHRRDVVDRRQSLLIQALGFGEKFRCDLFFGGHGADLPA